MNNTVLFFDGSCGMCDTTVQFILKNEKTRELKFSPLQSDFAKTFLGQRNVVVDYKTIIIFHKGQVYYKTRAFIVMFSYLKMPISLLGQLLKLVPLNIANIVYDYISRRRDQQNTCGIFSRDDRERFLT